MSDLQVVKTEFTASAKDFWITDWTSNDLLEDSGPPVSYDADPSEPFGTHCLKVSAWVSRRRVDGETDDD